MDRSAKEIDRILKETVRQAARRLPLTAAYLFGSYATGCPRDESDIDVALFSPGAEDIPLTKRVRLLTHIRLAVDAEIELHLFDDKRLGEARPTNIFGVILATGRRVA